VCSRSNENSMPSPRTRRLLLDHQTLISRLAGWPLIEITGTAGMPPEIYRFTYHIMGLYVADNGEILERNVHVLEANLSLGYPRRAPQCRMLTPVFHPNFNESMACIGDFWAASEGLDDLVIRIGRMIAYQEYNTKSPLNGLAAKWATQNANLLPVDPRNIAPPLEPTEVTSTQAIGATIVAGEAADTRLLDQPAEKSAQDPWEQKISIT
jgi:ubiquitin-protein ligase